MNTSTRLAIKWIGVICSLALGTSMLGIISMVIFPAIKDPVAMTALITVAQISGLGVTGLVGFLHPSPLPIQHDTIKKAAITLSSTGTPQITEEVNP